MSWNAIIISESNEIQRESGFGLVKVKLEKLIKKNTKIHNLNVGWQDIQIKKSRIFNGIQNNESFIFYILILFMI